MCLPFLRPHHTMGDQPLCYRPWSNTNRAAAAGGRPEMPLGRRGYPEVN